jgi:protein involved in polysaccharide export with SLBB domain
MKIMKIMKKVKFIVCLLIVPLAISQEIDESFLKTLPKDMQSDILGKVQGNEELEDPVFRSIESQTKLEKRSLEDLKERLEADLEYLKNMLDEDGNIEDKNELILFGSNFFSTYQSTYMPINEPNLSSEYILDYGDVLEIQIIGEQDRTKKYTVARDGSINLLNIGKIKLSGLSLNEASKFIKAKVSASLIGNETYVSLSSLRDINILVSGNAFNPGVYTVSGNSNLLHVLAVAGGINDFGTYREINLIRDQKVIDTLDMYDVLITGKYNSKVGLRSGDIVFVKSIKKVITVDGAVKIPAKYELKQDQNLSDAIQYANGLTVYADLSNIYLDRLLDGRVKSLPINNVKQFDNILANDGDKILIRKHSFRNVKIEGAILKPGEYLLAEDESISDLIEKSGGYTQNAYPFGAIYENKRALLVNKMAKDALYEEFIDNIITVSQKNPTTNTDITPIVELTKNLKNTTPNGRVAIDLLQDDSNNLVMQDGDRLMIPEKPDHVYIYGEVSYEGAQKYDPGKTLDYYLSQSGGLKETADDKAIYVLQPNGNTQRSSIKKSLFQNNPNNKLVIYPGSVIFVPRGIDNSATNRLAAQAYVSILGNLGITLASLSSINNN